MREVQAAFVQSRLVRVDELNRLAYGGVSFQGTPPRARSHRTVCSHTTATYRCLRRLF